MLKNDTARPVTIVGGGLAGLTAAIACAEAGRTARLLEARRRLGGRARSTEGEWTANFGPHGLCSSRANWTWLAERGLLPTTEWVSPAHSRFHHDGRLRRIPPRALLKGFFGLRRAAPVERSFAEWAPEALGGASARALIRLASSSFSYHHDPGHLAAAFVWERIRWLFAPPTVHRVVGGWSVLVESLAARARELGVEIETGHAVEALPDPPVVVAVHLPDAARLLGRDLDCPSGGGIALDLGLESRRGDPGTILDLDHGVLLQAQPAVAAPAGHALYQAHLGSRPGEPEENVVARMEDVFDHAFSGWRGRVAWRRKMNVAGRTGAVDPPGRTWRDRPSIEQGDGVFLAGDQTAAVGLLSEVAFMSGIEAGRRAAAWTGA